MQDNLFFYINFGECAKIREEVFVKEKGFNYDLEFDDIDCYAEHVAMYLGTELIGCGRIYEIEDSVYRIGRVAILKEYRNMGYGMGLLRELERRAGSHGAKYVTILGILSASDFYRKAGYRQIGGVVFDENVPSVYMRKKLL